MERKMKCTPSHCPRRALLDAQKFSATNNDQREKVAEDIRTLLANCREQGAIVVTMLSPSGEQRDGKMCAVDWRKGGVRPILGRGPVMPMFIGYNEEPAQYLLPPNGLEDSTET